MTDDHTSSATPPPGSTPGGDPTAAVPAIDIGAVVNGGVEIEIEMIDGSREKVKVRQLPIALVGEWGNPYTQRNEAHLVELLCDKVDRTTVHHLRNAQLIELRLTELLSIADATQIEGIQQRLTKIRDEIAAHESKPRWSDTITHESAAKIRAIGAELNKKKFAEQLERTTNSANQMLKAIAKESAPPSSSSSSPGSAGSTSNT